MTGRYLHGRGGMVAGMLRLPHVVRDEIRQRERVEEILELLEIAHLRHHGVTDLSYGFQKRVELGRALAQDPSILFLDEPMAGMTVDEKEDMSAFILASRDALDNTVVLIEHDMGVVMDLAEHVVVLDFGRKIGDGTPAEVRRNEAVITAYLGADSRRPPGRWRKHGEHPRSVWRPPRRRAVALRSKRHGLWKTVTYGELRARVAAFAGGLHALGVAPGDPVALVAENSPEWVVADLAIQWLGATSVALAPQTPHDAVVRVLGRSGAAVVICGDQEHVDTVLRGGRRAERRDVGRGVEPHGPRRATTTRG